MAKVTSAAKPMTDTISASKSGKGDGPTASCRDYSKSGKGSSGYMSTANFNPQKVAASKIYVGGV
jgi:hypothetical protein